MVGKSTHPGNPLWRKGAGHITYQRYTEHRRLMESRSRAVEPRGELANFEKATLAIFNRTAPSVADIFTENAVRSFFGTRELQQGAGSPQVCRGPVADPGRMPPILTYT